MIKVLELFGGIGACTQALKNLGIEFQIADYVEIDKYAVASYNAMNGTDFQPQDITKWDKNIAVDLILHGSPCQDFSLSGKQAGGDEGSGTRSSLMYETIRIVKKTMPQYVIWENVKNLLSKKHKHNFDNYIAAMNEIGYNSYYQVLNAKDYGIPQNRERVFTISIRKDYDQGYTFPEKEELKLKLKDMLEPNVDEKYFLSDKMISCFMSDETEDGRNAKEKLCDYLIESDKVQENDMIRHSYSTWRAKQEFHTENSQNNNCSATLTTRPDTLGVVTKETIKIKNATKLGYLEAEEGDGIDISTRMQYHRGTVQKGIIQTLDCKGGEGHGVVEKQIDKLRIRKLTPRETWRLMRFPDQAFEKAEKVNSNAQLYKQAGNSIVVNVLEKILKNLIKEEKKPTAEEKIRKANEYLAGLDSLDQEQLYELEKILGEEIKNHIPRID